MNSMNLNHLNSNMNGLTMGNSTTLSSNMNASADNSLSATADAAAAAAHIATTADGEYDTVDNTDSSAHDGSVIIDSSACLAILFQISTAPAKSHTGELLYIRLSKIKINNCFPCLCIIMLQ
jgi:hypothetical protein